MNATTIITDKMLRYCVCVLVFVCNCKSFAIVPVMQRSFKDGRTVKVFKDISIEERPGKLERREGGLTRISGGNVHTHTFVMQISGLPDCECQIVWVKSDVFVDRQLPWSALERLRIFDIAWRDSSMWILYTFQDEVRMDVVEVRNDSWLVSSSQLLFKQSHSGITPRVAFGGEFIVGTDQLFVDLRMTTVDASKTPSKADDNELWTVSRSEVVRIQNEEEIDEIRKAAKPNS